ncbi:MAG: S1 RNA-binding domain-containing protein [Elusimicrobia bacterium]|nr:S1 RNA-binding domain-containing protein [Elusimicrobiota bacterium]
METNEIPQQINEDVNPAEKEVKSGADEEMSMDELLKAEAEVTSKIYSRDIVKVKVVQITPEHVLVDIGEKKEAIIPLTDFEGEKSLPQVGAEIIAVLEKKGGEGRHTLLSHKKAREKMAWNWAKTMFQAKERLKGRVTGIVKGGYAVDLAGLRVFMPLSLSEIGGAHKHYLPPNARIKFYIVDFSERDRKAVVSRRQVLEEDENIRKTEVIGSVTAGHVVRAVVAKVTGEGMFVRFQGIEGYVRLSDAAWKNPAEALKTYKRGQRIKCKVLSVDKATEKLSFGIKQLTPNPVDILKKKFGYRSVVRVKTLALAPEGAKVKVSEQVDGFVPAEEYGSEGAPKAGQELTAVVVGVNSSTYELTLSVRSHEELEDRKRMQQYLKGSPTLTLGQILLDNSEDEGEV